LNEFRADDEYFKVEGWLPVDVFNDKPDRVTCLSKPCVESKSRRKNVVSVDVKGNRHISEDIVVVDVRSASSFRIKTSSTKAAARSGISSYSRHMPKI
jgi:hypothetical protein